jgi:hypothetical protein
MSRFPASLLPRTAITLFLLTPTLAPATTLPPAIDAPGLKVIAQVHAVGDQIYDCQPGPDGKLAWIFREPLATLLQGAKTVGRHFAGPEWLFDDGSFVKGAVTGEVPGAKPADVPWLRLKVTDHGGQGALAGVTVVQRIDTEGGAFAGACTAKGTLHLEPYSANYVFLGG